MNFVLVGNYGRGNVGDEALREYFLQVFPEVEWQVVSAQPRAGELSRLPAGIRSLLRRDWWQTVRALRQSDGMVFGGGSLFTDAESVRACLVWAAHAWWAWICRKPIILAFQGVGPLRTRLGTWLTRWVCRRAAYISVRDDDSYQRVQNWQPHCEVVRSFDPVFTQMEPQEYDLSAEKNLVVIPRRNTTEAFSAALQELVASERWERVICVALQPNDPQERRVMLRLREQLSIPVQMRDAKELHALVEAVALGSFVLSQRYHGALAAMALGRELQVVPQKTGDKLASVQRILQETPLHDRRQRLRELVHTGEQSLRTFLASFR